MYNIIALLISLVLIVAASNIFCNALEHLGERLGVSAGVTGSIFAAVGTALPETMIPILAIYTGHGDALNNEIGIGAILGAPLMLSTLSVFVMAMAVIAKRGLNGNINAESTGLQRDLKFFGFSYSLAFVAAVIPGSRLSWLINTIIVIMLLGSYFIYILLTVKSSASLIDEGHTTVADEKLFLERFKFKVNSLTICVQLFIGLLILIYFAEVFINAVKGIASNSNVSAFLLSLIIIPIATELPEKINSILWVRKNKDTLAMGNITGAMVFQGTLLPVIGILFGNWSLNSKLPVMSIAITLFATLWLYFNARRSGLKIWHFLLNGLLYILNITAFIFYG